MISAPFLTGCPTALDRAAWFVLSRGALDSISWPLPSWALWAVALPAVAITACALWVWYGGRRNAAVVVAVTAAALHPPLLLSLAPLLTIGVIRAGRLAKADVLRLALLVVTLIVVLVWLTPDCRLGRRADIVALARGVVATMRTSVGVIALLLALFATIGHPRAPHTIAAWLTMATSIAAAALFQDFDARITLVPAAVSLWWLAVHAAAAIIRGRPALPARSAASVVMLLVPILQVWTVAATPSTDARYQPTSARAIAAALDRMWKPSALASEDTLHDRFATMWAAGRRQRGTTLPIVTDVRQLATDGAARSIYAFSGTAARFALRGSLVAPVETASSAHPVLWRVLATRECTLMTPQWKDVTSLVGDGQISGVFERGATGRHAIAYAALPADANITAINWPEPARPGLRVTAFNLADAASRREYYQSALADAMPLTLIPSDTAFVARILLGRMAMTPGALAVAFETIPRRLVARLDAGTNNDTLQLCRSAQDLAVVGYPEAPVVAPLNVTSPATAGRGWNRDERSGDTRFRWTAGRDSDIRFIAAGPVRLGLTLQVNETAGGHRRDAAAVLLNGAPSACEARDGGCTWLLPIDAVRTGLNIITLHADLAPNADTSRGLQLMYAELRALP